MKLTVDDLAGVISWNREFWPILTDKVLAVALLNFIENHTARQGAEVDVELLERLLAEIDKISNCTAEAQRLHEALAARIMQPHHAARESVADHVPATGNMVTAPEVSPPPASCTCPSGDGSLICPCPEHPEATPVDIAHLAGMAKELASNAHSHSKEACRLRQSTAHKLAHELRQMSKENK